MFIPKWCKNFVPRKEYNQAYINYTREWNGLIQQRPVNWVRLQELCKLLAGLFGYLDYRVIRTIKNKDVNNLWFLH